MRRALRSAVVVTAALASLGMGATAWAATTSTSLSNGKLTFESTNGRSVSGNSSLFYSAVSYQKTGGSAVSVKFLVDVGSKEYVSPVYSVSSGQTKSYSFGGNPVPSSCRSVGGMDVAGQGYFWTPALNPC
ncbi:hypothetical protein ACWCRF_18860 [Streptomyces sp. NPDC002405]|uniref:hypothetical protein n=1 Tax=unclassified Streptomyces TaxID=2593676 RepID=UPI0036BFC33B